MYYHIYSFMGCGIMRHELRVLWHVGYFYISIGHILERRKNILNIWVAICIVLSAWVMVLDSLSSILGSWSGPPRAEVRDSRFNSRNILLQSAEARHMEHGAWSMAHGTWSMRLDSIPTRALL